MKLVVKKQQTGRYRYDIIYKKYKFEYIIASDGKITSFKKLEKANI